MTTLDSGAPSTGLLAGEGIRILMLEDSAIDADLAAERLRLAGITHSFDRVETRSEFSAALGDPSYDLLLADYTLPEFDGLAALSIARDLAPDTPFIVLSGTLGEEAAIEMIKLGASDYVLKQRLQRLPFAVRRALAEAQAKREAKRAQQRQALLVAELNHRVKNMLAVVQSLAQRTARSSGSLADFEQTFGGRIQALSDAHDLVLGINAGGIPLERLVERILVPFGLEGRLHLQGPELMLVPQAAMSLALVFHELATNAIKHGALSVAAGTVDVTWSQPPNGPVELLWQERGGPPAMAPTRHGFGLQLIRQGVSYELDGTAEPTYGADGLRWTFTFPLS